MVCQKVCKQGRDDIKVNVNKTASLHLSHTEVQPSHLYHPHLVCILFGMLSLHLITFFLFLYLLILIYLRRTFLSSVTTTPELETV